MKTDETDIPRKTWFPGSMSFGRGFGIRLQLYYRYRKEKKPWFRVIHSSLGWRSLVWILTFATTVILGKSVSSLVTTVEVTTEIQCILYVAVSLASIFILGVSCILSILGCEVLYRIFLLKKVFTSE